MTGPIGKKLHQAQSAASELPDMSPEDIELVEQLKAKRADDEERSRAAAIRLATSKGWNVELVQKAFHPKPGPEVIQRLSWELWIEEGVHRNMRDSGQIHFGRKVLSIGFIKYMTSVLIDRCLISNLVPPVYLVYLIRDLLDVKRFGHASVRLPQKEYQAALMLANLPDASLSDISEAVGTDKSTVSRWRKSAAFKERVEKLIEDDFARFEQERLLELGFPLPDTF